MYINITSDVDLTHFETKYKRSKTSGTFLFNT